MGPAIRQAVSGTVTFDGQPLAAGTIMFEPLARSNHVGGVHAGLLDGSARFVSDDVNLDLWRSMGTSQGGEVVTLED